MKRVLLLCAACGVQCLGSEFVEVGAGNVVTFAPSSLVGELLEIGVAGVLAGLAATVLSMGLAWVFATILGKRRMGDTWDW